MAIKILKSIKYFLIIGIVSIVLSLFSVSAREYNPTTNLETNLGRNVNLYETKGEFLGSQSINYVTFNPVTNKSIKLIPWAILNSTTSTNTRSTVLEIAKDYELKNPNSKVIAGINADFFPFVSTNENPFSAQVIDGDLHQAYVFTHEQNGVYYPANALGIFPDGSLKSSHIISHTQATYLDIFGENNEVIYSVQLAGFNSAPGNNQTSAYFGSSFMQTLTSTDGVYYVSAPKFLRDDNRFARGVISSSRNTATLERRTFAITTKDPKVKELLDVGVEIRVTRRVAGDLEGAQSVVGFYGHPLKNGEIPNYGPYPTGLGGSRTQSTWTTLQPRTFLGVKEDGSVIMGLVEGRATGKLGFSGQGVGEFLQSFDAKEGYMFDGGGSSTLVARVNGVLKQVATGTDGVRAIVNALLLVEQEVDPIELNPVIEDIKSDSFKIKLNPTIPAGFVIEKIEAIINDSYQEITNNELLVEGANVNSSNSLRFKVYYKENGQEKEFTTLKNLNVQTIAMPPEVIIDVKEVTTTSITVQVTLERNGSVILESYFSLNDDSKTLPVGTSEFTFTDLEPGTKYTYTAIVNYNDENAVKFYTYPITEIETKTSLIDKKGCFNASGMIMVFASIALLVVLTRRRFK